MPAPVYPPDQLFSYSSVIRGLFRGTVILVQQEIMVYHHGSSRRTTTTSEYVHKIGIISTNT